MVRLNFDGACHPNPGLAAWGCVIVTDTHTHAGGGPVPGTATNNVAEYAALGNGLKEVIKLGVTGQYVECIGDSQLVVNQVNGVWQCHDERLKKCLARVVELIGELEAMGNTVGAVWVMWACVWSWKSWRSATCLHFAHRRCSPLIWVRFCFAAHLSKKKNTFIQ